MGIDFQKCFDRIEFDVVFRAMEFLNVGNI